MSTYVVTFLQWFSIPLICLLFLWSLHTVKWRADPRSLKYQQKLKEWNTIRWAMGLPPDDVLPNELRRRIIGRGLKYKQAHARQLLFVEAERASREFDLPNPTTEKVDRAIAETIERLKREEEERLSLIESALEHEKLAERVMSGMETLKSPKKVKKSSQTPIKVKKTPGISPSKPRETTEKAFRDEFHREVLRSSKTYNTDKHGSHCYCRKCDWHWEW